MSGLTLSAADELLDHVNLVGSYTPTGPLMLRLLTANGTASSAGTEVSGGSYAPKQVTFGSASDGAASNTAEITFDDMPAATVVGVEIWDSASTPVRLWWGPLAEARTVPAGGTLRFAAGELTVSFPAS